MPVRNGKRSVVGVASGLGVMALLCVLATGCSTATPVLVESGRLPPLLGRVNTTAGYTGTITTDDKSCAGSFTGLLGEPTAPAEISCKDGRRGVGTATIQDGSFLSALIVLSDGSRLTIRPSGPGFP